MKVFSKVATLGFICAVAVSYGCAKPDNQKRDAVVGANSAFSDLRISVDAAKSMGVPSTDWSEEKLATYADLMNSIESSANRAKSFDGKSGITIKETDGLAEAKAGAADGRSRVQKIRAEKIALAARLESATNAKHRLALIQGLQADIVAMKTLPNASWPAADVSAHERIVDHAESAGKQLAFLSVNESERDLSTQVEKLVQLQRAAIR